MFAILLSYKSCIGLKFHGLGRASGFPKQNSSQIWLITKALFIDAIDSIVIPLCVFRDRAKASLHIQLLFIH